MSTGYTKSAVLLGVYRFSPSNRPQEGSRLGLKVHNEKDAVYTAWCLQRACTGPLASCLPSWRSSHRRRPERELATKRPHG